MRYLIRDFHMIDQVMCFDTAECTLEMHLQKMSSISTDTNSICGALQGEILAISAVPIKAGDVLVSSANDCIIRMYYQPAAPSSRQFSPLRVGSTRHNHPYPVLPSPTPTNHLNAHGHTALTDEKRFQLTNDM